MSWDYKFSEHGIKKFRKLNPFVQKIILAYLNKHVRGSSDPRLVGKKLVGNFTGAWRYRVGDYRILCKIRDHELLVFIIAAGHRKNIYD